MKKEQEKTLASEIIKEQKRKINFYKIIASFCGIVAIALLVGIII